jgi:hypothetical protein
LLRIVVVGQHTTAPGRFRRARWMTRNVTAVAMTNNGSKMKTNNDSISVSVFPLSRRLHLPELARYSASPTTQSRTRDSFEGDHYPPNQYPQPDNRYSNRPEDSFARPMSSSTISIFRSARWRFHPSTGAAKSSSSRLSGTRSAAGITVRRLSDKGRGGGQGCETYFLQSSQVLVNRLSCQSA